MFNTPAASNKQRLAPRLVASWPTSVGTVWLAQGVRCPCGALVSRHPRQTDDGGAEVLCTEQHVFARFEFAAA